MGSKEAVARAQPSVAAPTRPAPAPSDEASGGFVRGRRSPRGIEWYGIRSFWGHLQHFVASAIATEDIDSRDWMQADPPEQLARAIVEHLAPRDRPKSEAETITEAIGRDLWIDYVADCGDDVSVSEAVARIVFAPYELPDPERDGEHLVAPRGDVLLFGGDTAYPVATAGEIHDRVVVPFNRVLAERRHLDEPGTRRVLLGIPGNHDWYDGLDGFGRLFRKRVGELAPAELEPSLTEDRESRLEHVVQFVEKFVVGGQVEKQRVLVLDGYVPFQHASYFALPLAPGLDLFAADRQLRGIDFRQRRYFADFRARRPDNDLVVVLPDPVYAFLEPSPTGVEMAQALELDLEGRSHLVVAGDLHHYERRSVDASLHVTAGGGGAFLHPARLAAHDLAQPDAQWPGVEATKSLLWQVPWRVALGRSGLVPHLVLLLLFAPALGLGVWGGTVDTVANASVVAGVVGAIVFALIGGIRRSNAARARKVLALSAVTGVTMGFVPAAASEALTDALVLLGVDAGPKVAAALTLLFAVFLGAFAFGAFLAALTAFGLESTQAFTCLGHPGFKHFVRMRVRKDGSAVDAWVVGLLDPLREGAKPVLVDRFTWRPQRRSGERARPGSSR